jgi:plastocyanin
MIKQKLFWLPVALALAAMVGCTGNKEETTEQPGGAASGTSAEAPPTPIDQSTVGEVTGKVTFQGEKPKMKPIMMDQDPVCVKAHEGQPAHVEDGEVNANGTLPNAFIYVKAGAEKYTFATPTNQAVLDQKGCMYGPHVLGVMVGQDVHIVSSDPTTHNIHPMPKDNREWNESQAPGAAPIDKTFAREEIMIPVKCNQHNWMRAYIGVMKNPFFAVTGSDGTFTIKGLPPGDYTLGAWTATYGEQEQKVTVGPKETKTVDFAFKS